MTALEFHRAVMGQLCEQEGTRYTALGESRVKANGGGDDDVDPASLLVRKSRTQLPSGLNSRMFIFCSRFFGMIRLKAEVKSRKTRWRQDCLLSRWLRSVWTDALRRCHCQFIL